MSATLTNQTTKASPVAQALSQLLAETYLLQLKTQNYHWNVTGPQFYSLHLLFEAQYDELSSAVDEIAERIRTYSVNTPASFEAFNQLSTLKPEQNPSSSTGMLQELIEAQQTVIKTLQQGLNTAQQQADEPTADLYIQRMQAHEKQLWMLQSQL